MKDMDFAKLVELMEDVKEAAGNIQLECIQEKPDMRKVFELVSVGVMGLIGLLIVILDSKSGRED